MRLRRLSVGNQKMYTHQLNNKASLTVLVLAIVCHRYEISASLSHHSVKAQDRDKMVALGHGIHEIIIQKSP